MPRDQPDSLRGAVAELQSGTASLSVDDRASAKVRAPPAAGAACTPISAQEFACVLRSSPPASVLVIDIRPATVFRQGHVHGSVSLCAPTTLLRRPDFCVRRLLPMLGSDRDRERVQAACAGGDAAPSWVVALDRSSTHQDGAACAHAGGGGASLVGLLRKFELAGYHGQLRWLQGGYAALAALPEMRAQLATGASDAEQSMGGVFAPRNLSLRAFQGGSSALQLPNTHATDAQAVNPFFDNIRQNMELAAVETAAAPFEMRPLTAPELARLPRFLRTLLAKPSADIAQVLAAKFTEIEKHEQARLQGIMARHMLESSDKPPSPAAQACAAVLSYGSAYPHTPTERPVPPDSFPLSITAALERGHDNRYRNFWTYEHSRVKLARPIDACDPSSNYLNASFVNPLRRIGGHQVFVATQAPLPFTFAAFWAAVWEQRCPVIVMLSQEFEGGRQKCHDYWHSHDEPSMRIDLVSEEPLSAPALGIAGDDTEPLIVRRMLQLTPHGDTAVRTVVQLQCLSWPDHGVPDHTDVLLALIRLTREAAAATRDDGPLFMHCSAGAGRTGTHIAIHAIISFLCDVQGMLGDSAQPCADDRTAALPRLSRDEALARWEDPGDMIYYAVCTMREQRMSLVHSARQYAFTYRAVAAALRGGASVTAAGAPDAAGTLPAPGTPPPALSTPPPPAARRVPPAVE
ncbi:protein-tyrosine-phosphatase [Malassezia sp. CBS 17886]|nr:protein-tyrosine-phosphatase [Malassezia sp. CBS 17886]